MWWIELTFFYFAPPQRFSYYEKRRRNRESKRTMLRNMSEYAEYLFQVNIIKILTHLLALNFLFGVTEVNRWGLLAITNPLNLLVLWLLNLDQHIITILCYQKSYTIITIIWFFNSILRNTETKLKSKEMVLESIRTI